MPVSRPSNRRVALGLSVAALAVLTAVLVFVDRAGGVRRAARDAGAAVADRAAALPVDLAAGSPVRGPSVDGPSEGSIDVAEDSSVAPARESLGPAADEPPPLRPVRGQVLDEFGVPVAGEWVLWVRAQRATDRLDPFTDTASQYAQTDATGWFEFPAHHGDAGLGGVLEYGIALFAGVTPSAPVDPRGRDHFLQYPTRGPNVPALVVELVDARDGAPLTAHEFDLRLVRPVDGAIDGALPESITSRGSWRLRPHPATVLRQFGRVRVERLAPGTWSFFVRDRTSLGHTGQFVMPLTGDDVVVEVALDVLDGSWLVDIGVGTDAVPLPDSGFDRYVPEPEKRRAVGSTDSNRHFVHTLRGFGSGPFDGAYLELELEAVPDACDNDTLNLEFAGGGFAWGLDLATLTGSSWSLGTRARLVLDLANLPGGPQPIDLLAALDDGALDVYVQDDTAVHSVRLHVRPAE
jgi:hypothetical protein